MGRARAFLVGGAHAVVGSQWPEGLATIEMLTRFYRRFANGEAPSPALRAAKPPPRSARATGHPFYKVGGCGICNGGRRAVTVESEFPPMRRKL